MGLQTYRHKRNFSKTPEPEGTVHPTKGQLRFVVQKHAASHLHYDFRLELDGVLKSWAVPKGPSVNPADKRLAMMVEDHPYDYRTFEGIIPKGNYGGGTVMVWDEGTYESRFGGTPKEQLSYLREGLRKGQITFILHGNKLKGEFTLVKIHNRGENAWLLIKKGDEYADETDITKLDRSVKTGRTLDEIAQNSESEGQVWESNREEKVKSVTKRSSKKSSSATTSKKDIELPKKAVKKKLRELPEPMKATLSKGAFDHPDWIFEMKWDGFRAVSARLGKASDIYSRNFKSFTDRFPQIAKEFQVLFPFDIALDGEICCIDEKGRSSFQLLQQFQLNGRGTLVFYVFDVLYYKGYQLYDVPLLERKKFLKEILPASTYFLYSDHVEQAGKELYEFAAENKQEGIIAKLANSTYDPGRRSKNWLKIKAVMQQEAIICGYTAPRGGRKHFGSLILGVRDGDELRYIGHTGTGFNEVLLKELKARLDKIKQDDSPFKKKPKTNQAVTWVRPKLVAEIKFQEWTSDGILRQPVFLGLRDDKTAREVVKEVPDERVKPKKTSKKGKADKDEGSPEKKKPVQSRRSSAKKINVKGKKHKLKESAIRIEDGKEQLIKVSAQKLKFTNLDKLYWTKEKIAKIDLIRYYDQISPFILPYLKDRPESLKRHPNGAGSAHFFQKDVKGKVPDWIETFDVESGGGDKTVRYMLCQGKAELLYMANLGCIEINPWHSRIQSPDNPDYIIIDLDPLDIGFDKVIEAAQVIRQLLEGADIPCYPKTSGSKGIHIFIPMGAKYSYEQGRQFAELIATLAHHQMPDFTSIVRSPAKRKGKLYLDYLQNNPGQTIASPYCLRPKPNAPVSTPLYWEEIKPGLQPDTWNITNIFDRLKEVGDIFYPVLGKGIDIEKSLKRLT